MRQLHPKPAGGADRWAVARLPEPQLRFGKKNGGEKELEKIQTKELNEIKLVKQKRRIAGPKSRTWLANLYSQRNRETKGWKAGKSRENYIK